MSTPRIPGPPPDAERAPRWAEDTTARKEVRYWADEETLRGQRALNDLWWLRTYGWAVVALTAIIAAVFGAAIVVWAVHHLAPESWRWLTEQQLSKIQSLVFSGTLGAIVSAVLQKQLSR
ncbi:hypothetical protein [Roseospira goensis]|uniref:Chloride channel protein n=1 Tax=Roseospira goensis TaxID=391922 RepID=A0A7W6RYU3_9PROT|nr:hypothetical protein [Roseospira goensis]MBB4285754.1 hypothetical protein [Roseospira goensis]